MKKYYAARNYYGSETSTGFYNTWYVVAFNSRHARDKWVEDNYSDMSVRAITRKEAISYARRGNDGPRPFFTEYRVIVAPRYGEGLEDVEGCLGTLTVCRVGQEEGIRF